MSRETEVPGSNSIISVGVKKWLRQYILHYKKGADLFMDEICFQKIFVVRTDQECFRLKKMK